MYVPGFHFIVELPHDLFIQLPDVRPTLLKVSNWHIRWRFNKKLFHSRLVIPVDVQEYAHAVAVPSQDGVDYKYQPVDNHWSVEEDLYGNRSGVVLGFFVCRGDQDTGEELGDAQAQAQELEAEGVLAAVL